jgi:formate hydrogenlyase subunit 6/NADH:ubiquinone oxidoreductase subunit I
VKKIPQSSWRLTEADLREWLHSLLDANSVVAPVEEDGVVLFRRIASEDQAVVEPSGKTRWSPKEFLFPRSEALYRYNFTSGTVRLEDPPLPEKHQVLFGVRSCDASGLVRLDEIFLSGATDRLYAARRENTTVVSTACAAADPECFCTAVGYSPVGEEGVDVQLVPFDDGWMLRVLTDKGRDLVGVSAEGWKAATAKDGKRPSELEKKVSKQIERSPVNREWSQVLEEGFENGAWDRLAQHCLGCSVCAYVCPSCSCFDMNHEGNAWCGEQCRSWDACTFPLFTHHASGHNPRATKQERYRQRVLHKFAFREEDDEPFRCVGCGRCVALCPAGLDIVNTVAAAVEAIREEGADAAR